MFQIRKSIELDAGHRVPFHDSKCHHLHGHRYRVTAILGADEVVPDQTLSSDSGMVMDFGVIKELLITHIHDPYDHRLILWEDDDLALPLRSLVGPEMIRIVPCIPTAEELARFWGTRLHSKLMKAGGRAHGFQLVGLEVMETPTSFATYYI